MKKYLHIGYPKNLSTSLQTNFFALHPDLLHLGIGYNGKNLEYINDELSIYMESLLRARDIEFEVIKNEIGVAVKNSINREISSDYKYSGISHENLSFHFSNDEVDITQKVRRLHDLFGDDTKIIVVIRNQLDLMKSLYKESLKAGLSINFSLYIENLFMGKMHSYLQELQYNSVLDLYAERFGKHNILILPIENYRRNGLLIKSNGRINLIDDICAFMEIDYIPIDLGYNNVSINDRDAFQLVRINNKRRFGLSRGNYSPIDIHKYKNIFNYYGQECARLYDEVKIKRENLDKLATIDTNDKRQLDYNVDPFFLKNMKDMYLVSNNVLTDKYNVSLPDSYFDMSF